MMISEKELLYENYVLTIKSVKDKRIEQVGLKILPPVEKGNEDKTNTRESDYITVFR